MVGFFGMSKVAGALDMAILHTKFRPLHRRKITKQIYFSLMGEVRLFYRFKSVYYGKRFSSIVASACGNGYRNEL
jgi:hypothetical protein